MDDTPYIELIKRISQLEAENARLKNERIDRLREAQYALNRYRRPHFSDWDRACFGIPARHCDLTMSLFSDEPRPAPPPSLFDHQS